MDQLVASFDKQLEDADLQVSSGEGMCLISERTLMWLIMQAQRVRLKPESQIDFNPDSFLGTDAYDSWAEDLEDDDEDSAE